MKNLIYFFIFCFSLELASADSETIRRGLVRSGFGLALNLIQARNEGLLCEFEAYQSRITAVIDRVISLATKEEKEKFLAGIPKSSDLWANFMFKVVIDSNRFTLDSIQVKKYLIGSNFWGPSSAVGPKHSLEFLSSRIVKVGRLEMPENGAYFWTYEEKDWELNFTSSTQMKIRIGSMQYIFKESYDEFLLVPDDSIEEDYRSNVLHSSPMDCDA